jgi:hypothetical protein
MRRSALLPLSALLTAMAMPAAAQDPAMPVSTCGERAHVATYLRDTFEEVPVSLGLQADGRMLTDLRLRGDRQLDHREHHGERHELHRCRGRGLAGSANARRNSGQREAPPARLTARRPRPRHRLRQSTFGFFGLCQVSPETQLRSRVCWL